MRRLILATFAALFLLSMATVADARPLFGDGSWIVGDDINPGTYRTRIAVEGCYWERLSGFSGNLSDVIANDFTSAPAVITIGASDAGFTSSGCGDWTTDLSAITDNPTSPFSDGTYIVGVDIAPGTWRASSGDGCYWARLSGFSGTLSSVTANAFGTSTIVTISAGDRGFSSSSCGTWSKIR
jgi:hypothetical protein